LVHEHEGQEPCTELVNLWHVLQVQKWSRTYNHLYRIEELYGMHAPYGCLLAISKRPYTVTKFVVRRLYKFWQVFLVSREKNKIAEHPMSLPKKKLGTQGFSASAQVQFQALNGAVRGEYKHKLFLLADIHLLTQTCWKRSSVDITTSHNYQVVRVSA
jgi:hypothetical protein